MLPLSAETLPTTVPELSQAIKRGLEDKNLQTRELRAEGEDLADVKLVRIDLSGARLTRDLRPPSSQENASAVVNIALFELSGLPVYFEKTPLHLQLSAANLKAGMALDNGQGSLVLNHAGSGSVSVEAARGDLESFLHSFAVEAAAKQGFDVRKTSLTFTQEGPRAVAFRAEVTAKVFVMSATLALTGRVGIDDALNACVSNLKLDGDGMILKLAGSFARPHLDRLEGRVFPLLTFMPSGLKLRDVQITAGESLLVRALFGDA